MFAVLLVVAVAVAAAVAPDKRPDFPPPPPPPLTLKAPLLPSPCKPTIPDDDDDNDEIEEEELVVAVEEEEEGLARLCGVLLEDEIEVDECKRISRGFGNGAGK